MPGAEHHVRARTAQAQRDGAPNPTARTRDDGGFAVEFHLHIRSRPTCRRAGARRRLPILYLHHDLVKTRRLLSEDHRRHIGERMAPDLPLMLAWVARCAAGRYRAQSGGASRADLIIEYRPLPAARLPARLEPGTPGLRAWSKYANHDLPAHSSSVRGRRRG